MKKIIAIISLYIFIYPNVFGSSLNSLVNILPKMKDDTAKVRLLLDINKKYSNKDYDSFYYYLVLADQLSKQLKTTYFDFYIYTNYSEYYYYKYDYKNAIAAVKKSNKIALEKKDSKLIAKSYNNLAAVYNHFGQYRFAIDAILKCLDISERSGDSISFAIRNLTASATYYYLNQYQKSIQYAEKAVYFGNIFNKPYAIGMGLNNIASGYASLNMHDSAIIISKKQLDYAKKEGDMVVINYALINLCHSYYCKNKSSELEYYSAELRKYNANYPDSNTLAEAYAAYALNSILKKQYVSAKALLDSAIFIAQQVDAISTFENIYRTYSALFYLQGDISKAEYFIFKHDSIVDNQNIKSINFYTEELNTIYETEKKEVQIKLQEEQIKRKNTINYILLGSLLSALYILFLMYHIYKNKQIIQQQQIYELEKEKQLQATEAILKGQEEERSRIAKDLHDGLGGLLSGVKYSLNNMKENVILSAENASSFSRSIDMLDTGIQELRRIAHNMMPENLIKFGLDTALKDYCNSISKTNVLQINYSSFMMDNFKVDASVSVIVYRVIQELINNAIKHANASQLIVQLSKDENLLNVTVEDNGKGFDTTDIQNFKGAGWTNIHNRINYLKGKIDVQSSATEGTSINIEIPLV